MIYIFLKGFSYSLIIINNLFSILTIDLFNLYLLFFFYLFIYFFFFFFKKKKKKKKKLYFLIIN